MSGMAKHAADVLRRTGNPAVCSDDEGLIGDIAREAGMTTGSRPMHRRVMDAIDRSNRGELVKRFTQGRHRLLRCFWLPEEWDRFQSRRAVA